MFLHHQYMASGSRGITGWVLFISWCTFARTKVGVPNIFPHTPSPKARKFGWDVLGWVGSGCDECYARDCTLWLKRFSEFGMSCFAIVFVRVICLYRR